MALTEVQKAQVHKQLTGYCAKRVPAAVLAKVRVGHRIEGNTVILYEERPACQHRDLRWHIYQALPAASSFAELLDEVDADPTGIFWG